MTPAELKHEARYIALLKRRMCLSDWTIEVVDEQPDNQEAIASVEPLDGRRVAYIRLGSDWLKRSPEKKRYTIVHELVHLHHIPATDIIRLDMLKQLSQSTYDLMWGVFKRQLEYMVDGLSDAIAPLMPLPGKGKEK